MQPVRPGFLFDQKRGAKMSREKVSLVCTECGSRNYNATKKSGDPVRLEVSKFCPKCGKHTLHREGK